VSKDRRITLSDAVEYDCLDKIGREAPFYTSFELHDAARHDRDFPVLPTNGKELLANVYQSKAKVMGGALCQI
jgi:hypothetical protein